MPYYYPADDPVFVMVDEKFSGRVGTPYSMEYQREYERVFLVQVKSKFISEWVVSKAIGIPRGHTFYVSYDGTEWDELAVLDSIQAKPADENDWQFWLVTCHYTTHIPERKALQDPSSQNNPELEYPNVEWNLETMQYAFWFKDRKGVPLLNSAHMPFSPPQTFPLSYPVLTIDRNELKFNVQTAQDYAWAVNQDTFLGYPPGTVQCLPPKAEQRWKGGYRFWRVHYKLRFSPIVWIPSTPKILVKVDKSDTTAVTPPTVPSGTNDGSQLLGFNSIGDATTAIPVNENAKDVPGQGNIGAGMPGPGVGTKPEQGGGVVVEGTKSVSPWLISLYELTHNDDDDELFYLGWQPLVLDQGMYRLPIWPPYPGFIGPAPPEVAAGLPVPITKHGLPITHPDLLNGMGQPVARDPNSGLRKPVFLGFVIYKYRSFKSLLVQGLGN